MARAATRDSTTAGALRSRVHSASARARREASRQTQGQEGDGGDVAREVVLADEGTERVDGGNGDLAVEEGPEAAPGHDAVDGEGRAPDHERGRRATGRIRSSRGTAR